MSLSKYLKNINCAKNEQVPQFNVKYNNQNSSSIYFKFKTYKAQVYIRKSMKRQPLIKQAQTGQVFMSLQNLKICAHNQQGYQTLYLNDSLQLQYYNFSEIDNLDSCIAVQTSQLNRQSQQGSQWQRSDTQGFRGINTLYLNNNVIREIRGLSVLGGSLVTLNLSHNCISKFQGLQQLQRLCVLDLSYNKIQLIQSQQISPLQSLKRLSLASNNLMTEESIQGITTLSKTLQTLQLMNNQKFQPKVQVLTQIFQKLEKLKVLVLKGTPFVRSVSSYRKAVILAIGSLTYLDQRTVTPDERLLAQAWKRGGLTAERQARKLLVYKTQQKNSNILRDILERNKAVDNKVEQVYLTKAKEPISQLQSLKSSTLSAQFELFDSEETSLTWLKIQQLQRYMQLLREQCRSLDLDRQLGLDKMQMPRMLIQNRTAQCVFIYNVTEQQLELIRQKYYSEETLPLKAVNYEKKQQLEWLQEYDTLLDRTFGICRGNWEMILPSFNLDIYELDFNAGRKLRRFGLQQLKSRHVQICSRLSVGQSNDHINQPGITHKYNELDCLD